MADEILPFPVAMRGYDRVLRVGWTLADLDEGGAEGLQVIDELLRRVEITFPAPLAMIKMTAGLDAGLDTAGDLVVALMPEVTPFSTAQLTAEA